MIHLLLLLLLAAPLQCEISLPLRQSLTLAHHLVTTIAGETLLNLGHLLFVSFIAAEEL
jgi:hypothetical protein